MKQSTKAIAVKGLAGAVAVAGASQAYGTIISVTPPSNLVGVPQGTATGTHREYWDVDTGTTSTAVKTGISDFNFGLYSGTSAYPGEFFTGIAGSQTGEAAATYYSSSNTTFYALGVPKGGVIGTGGAYSTFGQSATSYTIMSLTYNGTAYAIQKPGTPYYVGFQFKEAADGLIHDGWVELESDTYTSAASPGGLKFIAAAYNNVADAAGGTITAGQMPAVPEPGTLSALALGAAALTGVGYKRRKAARAALPA